MSRVSGRTWLVWSGCLLLVLLASVFGRPDIPIDETRYVSVAWEMWSGGDWLVMHKNGEPYHHKPPLLFWLINLGWLVFGVNDWWPRCISAFFALACLGLTAAIARRLWPADEGIGERAGWLLLGGAFWQFFSTSVVFDVMLTAFVLLALLAAVRARQGERRGTWGLFGLAIGLGVLAKGPVVLLHALPVLLLAPWWGGRANGRGWYGRILLGVLLGAAIALAWAIPAAIRGGEEFRNAIFWGQTAGRVSGSLAHKQPFWFYVPLLPLLLFPWFFWGRTWRALVAAFRLGGDGGLRFTLAWLVPVFIGFSFTGGKQAHYLLPLLPAAALLIAFGLGRLEAPAGRWGALPVALVFAGLGGVLLTADHWAGKLWLAPYAGESWRIAGAIVVFLALALFFLVRGRDAALRLALAATALVLAALLLVVRPFWPTFDVTPMAERLKVLETAGVPVAHAGGYNDQYHYYGRLMRPLREVPRPEVIAWLDANPGGRVVAYLKDAADVESVRPEFWQPYVGGAAAVLLDADSARRLPADRW